MSERRRPNGTVGARTTISVPIALLARLRRLGHQINVSAVCTRAITAEVEMVEEATADYWAGVR